MSNVEPLFSEQQIKLNFIKRLLNETPYRYNVEQDWWEFGENGGHFVPRETIYHAVYGFAPLYHKPPVKLLRDIKPLVALLEKELQNGGK